MDKLKNIFIKLGQLDRRFIFLLIALSVLIPLLKPGWVNIPIKTTSNSEIVFEQLNNLNKGDRVLVSFEYGASTKPEIHPMSIAVLQHLFSKGIKVYESNRGGEITYHGPGQIIYYPIINLRKLRINSRDL